MHALRGVSVEIRRGEFVAIMGASGSGKSTFMNILGCLDKPTKGSYLLGDIDVSKLSRDELAHIRNSKIGFVFQGFNLLSRTSAIENVELPLLYCSMSNKERKDRAVAALRAGRTGGPDPPFSEPALRRPATACGHRPGARERSQHRPGGRTDGKPGQPHERGGDGDFSGIERPRNHGHPRDPRTGHRTVCEAPHRVSRREDQVGQSEHRRRRNAAEVLKEMPVIDDEEDEA